MLGGADGDGDGDGDADVEGADGDVNEAGPVGDAVGEVVAAPDEPGDEDVPPQPITTVQTTAASSCLVCVPPTPS